jgi:uncharacterized membrane protein YgdD (TMEM256/DUF423 family)
MPQSARIFGILAAVSLAIATVLGALVSHALSPMLDARALASVETANAFQFYHSLGLLGVAALGLSRPHSRWIEASGWLIAAGLLLFCGSVYAGAFGAPAWLGRPAPFGGIALIAGWLALAVGLVRSAGRA